MRRLSRLLIALVLVLGVLPATSGPAAGFTSENVEFIGHGWGHGRGMGQYGALGYAVNHGWNHGQILQHFYGNTNAGSIGQPLVSVHLTRANPNGGPTHIQQEKGQMVSGHAQLPGAFKAARISRVGPNLFNVERGDTCAGPWQAPVQVSGPLVFAPTTDPADHLDMIQVCEAAAQRWYRGNIEVHDASGIKTFNKVVMDDYLLGVVPRESPASWGDLGGGKGLQALKAQAVAARSYAYAESRFGGPATTCDTIACQVYLGFAVQDAGGFRNLEDPRTNRAVGETIGEVRRMKADNSVARTEFSSSTGGFTAGPDMGSRFPAVADAGDSISLNPNHTWKTTIPVAEIEAKYPGRGSLQKIDIPVRNGIGEWGGRVKVIRLVFSGGAHELTGDQFRRDFALKSNWFTVSQFASFGYHVLTADGRIHPRGGAPNHGDIHGRGLTAADLAEAPGGYWILATNGRVAPFGNVTHHGDVSGMRLNSPPNGIAAHPSGTGYWIVAGDGGVFSFDAPFYGSTGHMKLNQPVVGMAPTPSGDGYWLVALDGGVFTFAKAGFYGSTGNIKLNQPVFAMAPTKSGKGYWLVARDGGVFTFGDAVFHGSLPGRGVRQTAVEMLPSPTGNGYLIVTREGQVHAFGDATSGGGPFEAAYPSPTVAGGVPR